MKKQIKLTLLGTMLFTGAISIAEDKVLSTEKPKATVSAPTSVPTTPETAPADAKPVVPAAEMGIGNAGQEKVSGDPKGADQTSLLSKGWTGIKNFATNKMFIGACATGAVLFVAWQVYKKYVKEEAQAEQPLV